MLDWYHISPCDWFPLEPDTETSPTTWGNLALQSRVKTAERMTRWRAEELVRGASLVKHFFGVKCAVGGVKDALGTVEVVAPPHAEAMRNRCGRWEGCSRMSREQRRGWFITSTQVWRYRPGASKRAAARSEKVKRTRWSVCSVRTSWCGFAREVRAVPAERLRRDCRPDPQVKRSPAAYGTWNKEHV